jgi:protein-S-isoprenylcysteine O-methyltransferase Ste14
MSAELTTDRRRNLIKRLMTVLAMILCACGIGYHVFLFMHGHWLTIWPLVFYCIVLTLFFLRKPSQAENTSLVHWFFALCGSFLFFALHPVTPAWPWQIQLGTAVTGLGMFLTLLAVSQLGKGFGVIAACREIKTHGLYRVVRHPLYMGEEVAKLGIMIQSLSWVTLDSSWNSYYNLAIYLMALGCQLRRIRDEEALLSQYPDYAEYMKQVRFRLIPGVY